MNQERKQHLLERVKNPKENRPLHVIGLGRFGGNLALIEYLLQCGHKLVLWESGEADSLKESWQKLQDWHSNIEVHWDTTEPKLPHHDWVFVTTQPYPFLIHV